MAKSSVSEATGPGGLTASYNNCMGWSQMICALKVWLERGFNMREGMYK